MYAIEEIIISTYYISTYCMYTNERRDLKVQKGLTII